MKRREFTLPIMGRMMMNDKKKKEVAFLLAWKTISFSIIRLCLVLNAVLITIGTYLTVDAAAIFFESFL